MDVSIIIVQFNNPHLTEQCIESLQKYCRVPYEIILVDNDSSDRKARNLGKQLRRVRFIQNQNNEGFSKGNNIGAVSASGDIILFLNSDTVAEEDFISPVLRLFDDRSDIGIVGPRILNADHTLQLSCGRLPSIVHEMQDKMLYRSYERGSRRIARRVRKKYSEAQEVQWVTGAALFVRRSLFEQLDGFDEEFFMFFEDKDLCSRAAGLGAKIMYWPGVSLVHLRGASAMRWTDSVYRTSQVRYYEKHRNVFELALLKTYFLLSGKRAHAKGS